MNLYLCEVCQKSAKLTEDQAFEDGWDYPPFIGAWGVVSPRTCPDCSTMGTAWWALMVDGISVEDLPEAHKQTLKRIWEEVGD